jgi:hypothetical protein
MMRASTIVWVLLTAAVGTALFQIKHVVQDMDDELGRLNRAIAQEHRHTHILRAEWNYHNQPLRLQELAQRHLDLQPMKPVQLARLADLPRREPAPPPGPVRAAGAAQPARPVSRPPEQPQATPRPVASASLSETRGPR